jgi:hypothetical protein
MEKIQTIIELIFIKFLHIFFLPKNFLKHRNCINFGNYLIPIFFVESNKYSSINVFSAGIGNDLRFDLSVFKKFRISNYSLFDPTPVVIEALDAVVNKGKSNITFKENSDDEIRKFLKSVNLHAVGLSDVSQNLTMFTKPGSINASFLVLQGAVDTRHQPISKVVDVLDFVNKYGCPDIFKLDIEGYAGRVLLRIFRANLRPRLILGEFEIFRLGKVWELTYEILLVIKIAQDYGYKFIFYNSNRKPTIEFSCYLD